MKTFDWQLGGVRILGSTQALVVRIGSRGWHVKRSAPLFSEREGHRVYRRLPLLGRWGWRVRRLEEG